MFELEMKIFRLHIILFVLFTPMLQIMAQEPAVRLDDKIRIAEAIEIRNTFGESIWNGISKVPFTLILVTENYEYLFNHPYPSQDFMFLEDDSITKARIYYRKTIFPLHFQATFPAVNGLSCIVIGIPENTQSNTSSQWVLTVLHENFHQYQEYQPYYYQQVQALDLSGGDNTGMWMINYPFKYTDTVINEKFSKYTIALLQTIQSIDKEEFSTYLSQYQKAKNRFRDCLSEADYRYFSFQLWKEGIARYTEYKYLNALKDYQVSGAFQNLKDYMPFPELKSKFATGELKKLKEGKLSEAKREIMYPLGFAEGLLMDAQNTDWQIHYFTKIFQIENTLK